MRGGEAAGLILLMAAIVFGFVAGCVAGRIIG